MTSSSSPRYRPTTSTSGWRSVPVTAPTIASTVSRCLTLTHSRRPGWYLVDAPFTTRPSTPVALNASSHSRASSTSAVTGDSCRGGRQPPARDSSLLRRAVQRSERTSTPSTAKTSKATNDAGCAGARRRRTVAAVFTIRCCSASKSSRSPVQTTNSPSSTHSTVTCAATAARTSGNFAVKSLPFRDHNRTSSARHTTPTRNPSHFNSYLEPPGMPCCPGSLSTARASSSRTGPASSGDKLPMATVSVGTDRTAQPQRALHYRSKAPRATLARRGGGRAEAALHSAYALLRQPVPERLTDPPADDISAETGSGDHVGDADANCGEACLYK